MTSFKEERIRKLTKLYYSKPDIQKAIFDFSINREITPRYFEGFGKRPDSFQYPQDILELAKKGATSFHCSEELWKDPLKISTNMNEIQANELRIGWDLLIDIDCKWFDFAKLAAKAIIKSLKNHGIENIGLKFSGSKGFHILIPYKAFPKKVNDVEIKNLFPELARRLINYLRFYSEKIIKESLPEDFNKQFKKVDIKRGKKCKDCGEIANFYEQVEFYCNFCRIGEIRKMTKESSLNKFNCPNCNRELEIKKAKEVYECLKCGKNSLSNPENFSISDEIDLYELMGLDLVLVSPRHLFRMPYSLHEKTALASVVLDLDELENFELKDANPLLVKIKNFVPNSKEGEAKEFVTQALDWSKENQKTDSTKITGKYADFKPIKLDSIKDENFPPCLKNILNGVKDGKKRALFVLINFFRSIGMEKEILEKKIEEWNKKNPLPLKQGYIFSQLSWAYRKKPILPPNCKEFYQGIAVCQPDDFCRRIKNPVNYIIRKSLVKKKK